MPLVSLFSKLEAKPLLRMLLVRFEENHPYAEDVNMPGEFLSSTGSLQNTKIRLHY